MYQVFWLRFLPFLSNFLRNSYQFSRRIDTLYFHETVKIRVKRKLVAVIDYAFQ